MYPTLIFFVSSLRKYLAGKNPLKDPPQPTKYTVLISCFSTISDIIFLTFSTLHTLLIYSCYSLQLSSGCFDEPILTCIITYVNNILYVILHIIFFTLRTSCYKIIVNDRVIIPNYNFINIHWR